jgi:gamma-glutamylcyclotransferase (GGCT)/AIG2-like uncharacterized protein YtfP
MNPNLFVYGSLMSGAGHPMGERLAREARLLGAAAVLGRLYRISWYPGAVSGDDPNERVHGEVYVLDDPAHALAWLDAYEGIDPSRLDENEYERVERPVWLDCGAKVAAWVYLYRREPASGRIRSGRWIRNRA